MPDQALETWNSSHPYERYVGRWSRLVAHEFVSWLAIPSGQTWADVGCGTGALVAAILAQSEPSSVLAIDRSETFIAVSRHTIADPRAQFDVRDATALPWARASCDVTVSGLVLNFVPDANAMIREMVWVTRPNGRIAAYVWDYVGGMQMMRYFWDAARDVTPADAGLDQAERFPLCQPEPLATLFQDAGLCSVSVRAIEVPTVFQDFDDYWSPFLGRQGAAPTYLATVAPQTRDRIRELLRARLVPARDEAIALTATAWAIQGTV
jgi:SAM-dependent methyltransferase